jgi:transcriptional regulator with PAS, ATPase and Fis domain
LRVIAATNRDLRQRVNEGAFREDLLFRLDVFPIVIPPLRERQGDVTCLTNYFLEKYAETETGMVKIFDSEVLRFFESYHWPGNVRELQNVVRRMCIISEGSVIKMRELPEDLLPSDGGSSQRNQSTELSFIEAKKECLNHFEMAYLQSILNRCAGNVSRAAETADVDWRAPRFTRVYE